MKTSVSFTPKKRITLKKFEKYDKSDYILISLDELKTTI